jgi:glycosyltransferase involved in cell wall biosynthesis
VPDLRFAVPGDLETRTGGYVYDRRLLAELLRIGWSVELLAWGDSFPFPNATDLAAAARSLAGAPDGSLVLIDGLAYGALAAAATAEAGRLKLVALVHHPLARETGLTSAQRASLVASESTALRAARAVICTSRTTASTLVADYGIPSSRITVALPGTDAVPGGRAVPRGNDGVVRLLSVGTVTPRKGHDVLVEALARIAELRWSCTIVGSLDRAPEMVALVRQRIAAHRLDDRIALIGEVADLTDLYGRSDVFVLPSRYEGYGMAFAEALQQGLPVIGTATGAIPEVVPASAGILVAADDPAALAAAIGQLVSDPGARHRFAAGAALSAGSLPRWEETARLVAALLQDVGRCDG